MRTFLPIGFIFLTIFGLTSTRVVQASEGLPEDLAIELGLPTVEGMGFTSKFRIANPTPWNRIVKPENFKDFRINVDVFRASPNRPVLGAFRDEFAPLLAPITETLPAEKQLAAAQKRFKALSKYEFAVLSLDGVPFKAYLVSGAVERVVTTVLNRRNADGEKMTITGFRRTIPGNYRLDPLLYPKKIRRLDGTLSNQFVAFPWIHSQTFNDSPMYWGLWISGGYFMHSTPHYGELGRPASMGCIRQSYPDAQELFKLIVQDGLSAMIRIHAIGAKKSVSRLREIIADAGYVAPVDAPVADSPKDATKDMAWLLTRLMESEQNIRATIKHFGRPNFEIVGHSWIDPTSGKPMATTWPTCGTVTASVPNPVDGTVPPPETPIDCFKVWAKKKPAGSLN